MLKLYASTRRAKGPVASPSSSGDASSSSSSCSSSSADVSSLATAATSSTADDQKTQGQCDAQVTAETEDSSVSCDPSVPREKLFSSVSPGGEAIASFSSSAAARTSPAAAAAVTSLSSSFSSSGQRPGSRRLLPGELRLQKELEDLDLPSQCSLTLGSAAAAAAASSSAALGDAAAAAGSRSGRGAGAAGGGRAATHNSSSWRRESYQQQQRHPRTQASSEWLPWPGEEEAEERYSPAATSTGEAAPSSNSSNSSSLLNLQLQIRPDEGFWRNGNFLFSISVPPTYPHDPPKVKCLNKIFHPNIDLQGNVCLNILREDWKPVLSLSAVVYGLLHLFLEPNPNDPLNEEAANLLRCNPLAFEHHARRLLHTTRR